MIGNKNNSCESITRCDTIFKDNKDNKKCNVGFFDKTHKDKANCEKECKDKNKNTTNNYYKCLNKNNLYDAKAIGIDVATNTLEDAKCQNLNRCSKIYDPKNEPVKFNTCKANYMKYLDISESKCRTRCKEKHGFGTENYKKCLRNYNIK